MTTARYDADGRLRVRGAVISRGCTSRYLGNDMAHWAALGLRPHAVYTLLRSPKELALALDGFEDLPITNRHLDAAKPIPRDAVIGRMLGGLAFDGENVTGDLVIWNRDAIDAIRTGAAADLSLGYLFRADMSPGRWRGVPYHGVMREIEPAHLAIVPEGKVAGCTLTGVRVT
jgi:hypothetical protein